jgi:hypothetical protein
MRRRGLSSVRPGDMDIGTARLWPCGRGFLLQSTLTSPTATEAKVVRRGAGIPYDQRRMPTRSHGADHREQDGGTDGAHAERGAYRMCLHDPPKIQRGPRLNDRSRWPKHRFNVAARSSYMSALILGRDTLGRIARAAEHEWLVTNGLPDAELVRGMMTCARYSGTQQDAEPERGFGLVYVDHATIAGIRCRVRFYEITFAGGAYFDESTL